MCEWRTCPLGNEEHSMRLNEKPLRQWIILKDNGVEESAHCNCPVK